MPVFTEPQTGTRIEWTRHQRVTITALIPLGKKANEVVLPIRVRFSRQQLAQVVRYNPSFLPYFPEYLRKHVFSGLLEQPFSRYKPKIRIRRDVRPVPLEVTLYQQPPKDLQAKIRSLVPGSPILSFSQLPDFLEQYRREAFMSLLLWLLPFPPQMLLRLPRRGKGSWPLTRLLPAALFFARWLVDQAEDQGDPLREQLWAVLRADSEIKPEIKRQLDRLDPSDRFQVARSDPLEPAHRLLPALALVDRAFRGAWKRYGVKPPLAKPAKSFLVQCAQTVPAKRFKEELVVLQGEPAGRRVLDAWRQRLLSPPGQAALDFGLLLLSPVPSHPFLAL